MNFQVFKLVLEKAEEPEIKLPTSTGSWKKQESSTETSISALLTMPKPLTCVDHNKLWKILKDIGIYLPKETKDVYIENYKTLVKQIKRTQIDGEIYRVHELEESQAGIKIARRNINHLRYADDTTLNGRK